MQPLLDEAGVSQRLFAEVFVPSFEVVSKYGEWSQEQRLLTATYLRQVLARRRAAILPVGVDEEDIHRNKDRWTYVVFLGALIQQARVLDREAALVEAGSVPLMAIPRLLPEQGWRWIEDDRRALGAIVGVNLDGRAGADAQVLRRLLWVEDQEEAVRTGPEVGVEAPEPAPVAPQPLTPTGASSGSSGPRPPSKRELGMEFLDWLIQNTNADWCTKEENGILIIDSPKAFMEFGRAKARSWKAVQQGLYKLRLHQLNDEGSPLLKEGGRTIMRLNVSSFMERSNQ